MSLFKTSVCILYSQCGEITFRLPHRQVYQIHAPGPYVTADPKCHADKCTSRSVTVFAPPPQDKCNRP